MDPLISDKAFQQAKNYLSQSNWFGRASIARTSLESKQNAYLATYNIKIEPPAEHVNIVKKNKLK